MDNNLKKPRKLLMASDTVGGVWTYSIELIKALGEFGVEVALATLGEPLSGAQREDIGALSNARVHEGRFRLEWMEEPWGDVERAGKWLLDMEAEVNPDAIHLNSYSFGSLPFKSPKLVVGHSCVLSWWRAVKKEDAPAGWDRYREEVKKGLSSADMVVAPTEAMLMELYRFYDIPCGRVIPNGRTPGIFSTGEKEPFVFSVGRLWDGAKNAAALHCVAEELAWPVYFAGRSDFPSGRIALKDIRFLGTLSSNELANWYSRASIYALPAYYEPFGLSVLEAGLSGCALVLGDIPSLRETWDGAAVFVKPDDLSGIKEAITKLIQAPGHIKTMGRLARHRALEYSTSRMALGYIAAYREMLRRSENKATGRNNCESSDVLPLDTF